MKGLPKFRKIISRKKWRQIIKLVDSSLFSNAEPSRNIAAFKNERIKEFRVAQSCEKAIKNRKIWKKNGTNLGRGFDTNLTRMTIKSCAMDRVQKKHWNPWVWFEHVFYQLSSFFIWKTWFFNKDHNTIRAKRYRKSLIRYFQACLKHMFETIGLECFKTPLF